MDLTETLNTKWYQNKLTALLGVVMGAILLYFSWSHYQTAQNYRPPSQQVFLDVYNRPIGRQDLMTDTFHNPQYRKTTRSRDPKTGQFFENGETPEDFLKEALLSLFDYDKDALVSGGVLKNFQSWCSEDEANNLYRGVFVNLSQQRIVMAQDGLVRGRIIGDFTYRGSATRPYETTGGLGMYAKTHMFEGRMLVTAHGEEQYPTMYNVTALVQRALVQDKIHGYQIIELEMR